jgi:hypothetical protein
MCTKIAADLQNLAVTGRAIGQFLHFSHNFCPSLGLSWRPGKGRNGSPAAPA